VKFLVDMPLSPDLADWLNANGHFFVAGIGAILKLRTGLPQSYAPSMKMKLSAASL
jgi:hypothetical protein